MSDDEEMARMTNEIDALRADLAAAKAHNTRLIEAINRLHEVAQGMWEGSESEIADIVNSALAWRMRREQTK